MKILVTGSAGFIGFHLTEKLLERGDEVVGIDSINDYYDPKLKYARLSESGIGAEAEVFGQEVQSTKHAGYRFIRMKLEDREALQELFAGKKFDIVVNLAAQAGVRYSLENPYAYIESNIVGFLNLLECARHNPVKHFVYASSSSVYGGNTKTPFSEEDRVDNPVSLYAATKKSNELMAHVYSKLYGIPTTGLRFFTVYGPWGRPDMAYFRFTNKLIRGEKIKIFNYGNCKRDFTYIDDIVEGIIRVIYKTPECRKDENGLPISACAIYNIGNNQPENLLYFVQILQEELITVGALSADYDFEAHKELVAMQPGDVPVTYADTAPLERVFGFKPNTPLRMGLRAFAEWYVNMLQHNASFSQEITRTCQ